MTLKDGPFLTIAFKRGEEAKRLDISPVSFRLQETIGRHKKTPFPFPYLDINEKGS